LARSRAVTSLGLFVLQAAACLESRGRAILFNLPFTVRSGIARATAGTMANSFSARSGQWRNPCLAWWTAGPSHQSHLTRLWSLRYLVSWI